MREKWPQRSTTCVAMTSTFHSSRFRDIGKRCQDETCHFVVVYPTVSQSRATTLPNVHTLTSYIINQEYFRIPSEKTWEKIIKKKIGILSDALYNYRYVICNFEFLNANYRTRESYCRYHNFKIAVIKIFE